MDTSSSVKAATVRYIIKIKLLRWVLFNVCFSLIPIIFVYINSYISVSPIDVTNLVSNGELLIISCSLVMTATGELMFNFSKDGDYIALKTFIIGASIISGLLAGFLFAAVASENVIYPGSTMFSEQRVYDVSSKMFLICCLLSCTAIMLSEIP